MKKKDPQKKLEALRKSIVSRGISYDEQIVKEKNGEWEGLILGLRSIKRKMELHQPLEIYDLDILDHLDRYVQMYSEISGIKENLKGFIEFSISDYYYRIPIQDIETKIMASMITSKSNIRTGDTFDIKHASAMIPYVDIFITDRAMKSIIKSLEIPPKYDCRVFYSGDVEEIVHLLNA